MLKVGYIGLGLMGKSIARNILKAGFPLTVHNRSLPAVEELAGEGAVSRLLSRRSRRPGRRSLHQPARPAGCRKSDSG